MSDRIDVIVPHVCVCLSVYVKLGSDQPFSQCMLRLETPEQQRECVSGGKITGDCSTCTIPINCINWCNTVLVRHDTRCSV